MEQSHKKGECALRKKKCRSIQDTGKRTEGRLSFPTDFYASEWKAPIRCLRLNFAIFKDEDVRKLLSGVGATAGAVGSRACGQGHIGTGPLVPPSIAHFP